MTGKLLSLDQVAEYLGVHRDTVYNLVRSGKLPGFQLGGRKAGWRVAEEDLEAFINNARHASAQNGNGENAIAEFDRTQAEELQAFRESQAGERQEFLSEHQPEHKQP